MKLTWDNEGERLYETGAKKAVLYPVQKTANAKGSRYTKAVPWNGFTGVDESPEGAEPTDLYADDIKYLTLRSAETYKATIKAYMYPDEWAECDGSAEIATGVKIGQQPRKGFGFSYVSTVGNDTELDAHGYKIHIVYGGTASPSEKNYQTINDSPEANEFSWEVSTTPVNVTGFKPTASLEIDSTKVDATALKQLEDILYGTDETDGYLPLPDEIAKIFSGNAVPATDPDTTITDPDDDTTTNP